MMLAGPGWGGGVVEKEVGFIPRAVKLNTSDDEANKDETTPPLTRMHPDGKVRNFKGDRHNGRFFFFWYSI